MVAGCLQMGITGHDIGSMGFGLIKEGVLQISDAGIDRIYCITDPEPQVGGDLVICVTMLCAAADRLANQFAQPCFSMFM